MLCSHVQSMSRGMCWAEVSGTNFGRLLATSAAKCPHLEDKKRCGSFTGNTVQDCGLCKGNAHRETQMLLVVNGALDA